MQSQVVTTVDQWRSSLKFLDKEAEEVRLVRIVDALHASLRNNGAAICLYFEGSVMAWRIGLVGHPTHGHDEVILGEFSKRPHGSGGRLWLCRWSHGEGPILAQDFKRKVVDNRNAKEFQEGMCISNKLCQQHQEILAKSPCGRLCL